MKKKRRTQAIPFASATYYPLTPRTQATGYIDTDNIGLKDDDDTACSHEMK